jgi:DNA-binding transcriptional LysR family regulator
MWNSQIRKWINKLKHLGDIALFVEVVRAKSFRGAATALGVPNSTLSRRIDALEQALGSRLLKRTTRQIELTEAGQIYFDRIEHVVDEARRAHEQLTDMVVQPSGTLRVSLPVDFAKVFLAPLLPEFHHLYPDISFAMNLTSERVDLVADPFDLAIRMGMLPDSHLIAHKLMEVPRGLYASPSYLLSHGTPAAPDDLAGHECVLFPWEKGWTLTQGAQVKTVDLKGRFRINNVGLMQELAVEGMGIAMLSTRAAAADLVEGRLVSLMGQWSPSPIPVHALTETRLIPARTRCFIDFLKGRLVDGGVPSA